jgi:DNA repair protein RecO (recombination protein O)
MAIQKSDSVILSISQSGEGDIIAKALTSESGKRIFVFKGLKKSRKRAQIEPGLRVEIIYYYDPKKNYHIVKEFSITSEINTIRKDLDSIYHMMYMLESADRASAFDEKIQGLFTLISSGIETLGREKKPELIAAFYTVRLLKILGILHDFNTCIKCGSELDSFTISLNSNGPKCGKCSEPGEKKYGLMEKKFILLSGSKRFRNIEIPQELNDSIKALHSDLIKYLETYCGMNIKSGKLICKDS